jgi:lipopolysaccharide/colanic/teichoic acid biosynthesis glycosyltransferase
MQKRIFDILVGSVLAVLALPIIVVAAIGIVITLRVPPLFFQHRVGRDGRVFRFIKLRTLPRSFPRYADKTALGELRLPRFVAGLRRLHLDELPQLFLVPWGTMSLVGPRPEMPCLHGELAPSFARARTTVRPGCTGLWQVAVDSRRQIGDAPVYDYFYLDHRSFRLDLWILARTAALLVGRGRAVTLADVTPFVVPSRPRTAVPVGLEPVPVPAPTDGGLGTSRIGALEAT